MLILAAIPFYAFAVVAALSAWRASRSAGSHRGAAGTWLAIALLFAIMIVVRAGDLENQIRDLLRLGLVENDAYAGRRTVQALAVFAIVTIVAGLAAWRLGKDGRTKGVADRWRRIAALAGVAYVVLAGLRLVSLHQVDALLYGGLHLNRIVDPGLALVAGFSAMRFRKLAAPCQGPR